MLGRRAEGGQATLHCQSASLALVASFFHSSLRAGRTDGRTEGGREAAVAFNAHGRREEPTNERTNELPITFFGSKSRPGVEVEPPQQRRERRRRGCDRDRSGARVRACIIIGVAAQCHFVALLQRNFIFQVVRASRALLIAVNTLAKVTHERVATAPVESSIKQERNHRYFVK